MDLKELFSEITKIRKEGKIVNIEIKTPREVFGDKTRSSSSRKVAVIYTEHGREAHVIPQGVEYVNGDWKVVDEIQAIKSVRNPNSWFGKYFKKYNDFPRVGATVGITISNRGFTIIDV